MRAFRPDLAGASSIIDAARKDVQEYMMRPDEEYMRAFRAALDIHPIRRDPPQRRAQTARGHGERPMSVPTHGLQSAYLDAMDLCARPTSSPVFGQRSSAWGAEAPEAARKKPDYPPPIDLGALMPTKPNSPRGTPPSARSPRAKGQRHRRRGGRYLSKGDKPSMSPSYKPFVPPEGDIISARLRDGPRPWAQWPFVPVAKVADLTPSAGEKPGACTAPFACETTHNRVRLSWEASPPEEAISGYEVEICEIDALRGVQVWRRVHRGPTLECPAAFGRGVSGVRARVRAYNGKGKGEWSPVSTVIKLPQPPGPPRVEIDEIPGSWLAIDLAGLDEFKEHNDPSFMAATKEELLQAMYTARTLIKVAFRYYALAGVSNIDDDPNTMTMVQFGNFVKGASLFGTTLATSDVDRIFLRAVRSIPPGSDKQGGTGGAEAIGAPNLLSAASSTALKVSKEWRKVKAAVGITSLLKSGPATMSQPQFVQALIRMAAHKFADAPHFSLGEKFERLLSLHVAEHILNELSLIEDDFAPKMRGHLMGAVLEMHQRNLKHVFNAYAAADTSNTHARHTTATMNVKECFELCEDVGVFDKAFTTRHLLIAFVKVNIDDDVYVQDDPDNSPSELVFDEFEEWLARVFLAAVWAQTQKMAQAASLLDQDGDGDLDDDDVDNLFMECDVDCSGSVTVDELRVALEKRLNAAAADAIATQLAALADADGGGDISREELRDAVRKMSNGAAADASTRGPGALERAFETWLDKIFLPAATKAVAKKKLAVAK